MAAHALSMTLRLTLRAAASFAAVPRRVLRNLTAARTFACSSGVRSEERRVTVARRGFAHTSRLVRMVMGSILGPTPPLGVRHFKTDQYPVFYTTFLALLDFGYRLDPSG